jgi:hypothetical protein
MINMHYCMDEVDSVQLYAAADDVCNKCGMHVEDGKGCCRDEVTIVKLDDDQKSSQFAFSFDEPQQLLTLPSEFISISFYNFSTSRHFLNSSPPLLEEQDTYLKNRVIRI